MKKTLLILLLVTVVMLLAACSSGPGETVNSEPASQNSSQAAGESNVSDETPVNTNESFVFEFNGASIGIGDLLDTAAGKFGVPSDDDIVTTDSCAFSGKDTVYYYPSFEISANNETGSFVIYNIYLKDDTVSTKEGAYVGMTSDEVSAIYGTPDHAGESSVCYIKGDTALEFILKNGSVIAITYKLNK